MASLYTSIEISAPPSDVRAIFLDFPKYGEWHHGFFKSLTPHTASPEAKDTKRGTALKAGDTLHNILGGNMSFYPTILSNSTEEFRWQGRLWGIPGLFTAEHWFKFEASQKKGNEGGTIFQQGESFHGLLIPMIKEGTSIYKQTKEGFEGFNKDLKTKCEEKN